MQLFLTSEAKAEKMRHLSHIVKSENKSLNLCLITSKTGHYSPEMN